MRTEYFVSRKTHVAQSTMCILLLAGGAWILLRASSTQGKIVAAGAVLLGVIGGSRVFRLSHRTQPRLILSSDGLYDRQLGTPVIRWQSILAAKTVLFFGSPILMLLLKYESERVRSCSFPRRFGMFSNRLFGLSPFTVNLRGLDKSVTVVLADMGEHLTEAGLVENGTHNPAGSD